jgi:hypothetical protein
VFGLDGSFDYVIACGVPIFSHRQAHLEALMASFGFEMLKDLDLLVGVDQTERRDPYLALVTRKTNARGTGDVETKN